MSSTQSEKVGIILLAHGSRVAEANDEVLSFSALLQESTPSSKIAFSTAFLQFAQPSLEDSIREFVIKGFRKILVAPLFLTPGAHITQDIPEILAGARSLHPGVVLTQCRYLGCDKDLIPILWDRIKETLGGEEI